MADRSTSRDGFGTELVLLARSLVLLAILVVGVPAVLVFAARRRFGGGAPFHGVPPPSDWSANTIRIALADRLTEDTIADVVIRLALLVAWVGVVVIVLTVVAEVVHMVRHDGFAMPDVRALGPTQRSARIIASGLLVIVPLFSSPPRVVAHDKVEVRLERNVMSAVGVASPAAAPATDHGRWPPDRLPPPAPTPSGSYIVRAGDSIYGIAERMVGPDSSRVAAFAERLVDVNMGRQMPDGRRFDNAAFIDVGWVLVLPDGDVPASTTHPDVGVHVVVPGESLWSIADEELGDATRWPELYDANRGRTFRDGRHLDDPDLIRPGWELELPDGSESSAVPDPVDTDADADEPEVAEPSTELPATAPDVENTTADETAAPADPDEPAEADPIPVDVAEPVTITPAAEPATAPATRVNVWDEVGHVGSQDGAESESDAPRLLPIGAAAMLSAGVLTLLAVRRRAQLRRARPRVPFREPSPRPAATERTLRAIDVGERFARVETAVRAVAMPLVDRGERVLAVLVGPEGGLELRATGPVVLPAPWEGAAAVWRLAASTPLELLSDDARPVSPPCPALVQLGVDDAGRDVYVDLEALTAVEVGGPGDDADAVVSAVAATLSASLLAEVTTLVGLGVADDAFLGHRRYVPVRARHGAFEAASAAIGSTGWAGASTFELRATGTATETWEPAVVLIGSSAGPVAVPSDRTGLAVVSASPIHGPSSRLAPDGDMWMLQPAGIRLTPVGLTRGDIAAIAELVSSVDPELRGAARWTPCHDVPVSLDRAGLDDHTFITDPEVDDRQITGPRLTHHGPGRRPDQHAHDDAAVVDEQLDRAPASPPPHELLVRMIGPVTVVDRSGREVAFERSKTRELIAWLATHRERSTRSAARAALWELDVRDATFANVVSEARRSLARLVAPPDGDEWVGRTMTDSLPLHALVRSDADLLRSALDAARLQPPAEAIATLTPAVELIVGVPFEGTTYLWPDSEGITSNLVVLAVTATTELAGHCLSVGAIEGVFAATARGLQVLPAHEELIGIRMEAHARAGDHAGVRQEWESYERVINGDPWSDGEPAPKLVELRRRLLDPSR